MKRWKYEVVIWPTPEEEHPYRNMAASLTEFLAEYQAWELLSVVPLDNHERYILFFKQSIEPA
jgi:hypothetical protein